MVTKLGPLDATANIKVTASLPSTPASFYGIAANDVDSRLWVGGEVIFNSGDNRLYIQTATSGTTPTWKRLLTQFATTTSSSTSSSTSTSSTTTMA